VKFKHLWAPHHKYLETAIHTLISILVAKMKSPDFIHLHAIGPALFAPIARSLGLRVVVTHHGPDYQRGKWGRSARFILKLGEWMAMLFADRIIAVSRYTRKELHRKYRREDVSYIPNGVDRPLRTTSKRILDLYGLRIRKFILAVGRFVPEKNLHGLIHAYARLTNTEYPLVIVGDADHETSYSKSLKSLAGNTNGVILTGRLSGNELAQLYSHARLYVSTSLVEGLPITLLEALSYKLPVLVSDISAHREISIPITFYFRSDDKELLIENLARTIKKNHRQMMVTCKDFLDKEYSWGDIATKTLRLYNELYKGRNHRKQK
jgi:glycosyltransferase involved in cell wall biosynthesis